MQKFLLLNLTFSISFAWNSTFILINYWIEIGDKMTFFSYKNARIKKVQFVALTEFFGRLKKIAPLSDSSGDRKIVH